MSKPLQLFDLDSRALGHSQPFAVLPPDTLTPEGRCYTLMLLHGTGGDHKSWPDYTSVAELVSGLPILVLSPSAENAFYLDSEVARMETFLCDELTPYVDSQFPTMATSAGRGISGLSMGGFGALLLALRRPDLFGSGASHSGAVLSARARIEVDKKWDLADQLFGTDREGEIKRREHDILTLAQRFVSTDEESGKLKYSGPALYLDCGTEDFLFYASREVTHAMRMLGIQYEYHEWPGDHDWGYWNARLPDSLNFHRRNWGI